ncbi:MAG TPA: DUF5681 domain-containing protein [Thiobacillus sp.]
MADEEQPARDAAGRFLAGTSGNPRGRPPTSERIRQMLQPHETELVEAAVFFGVNGDTTALRLCLERLAPPPRPQSDPVVIPGLAEAATLTDKAKAVVDAVGNGLVSPDVAERLLGALAHYAKAIEVDELTRRVAALEAKDSV